MTCAVHFDAPTRPPRNPVRIDPLRVTARYLLDFILDRTPISIGAYDSIGQQEYARAFTSAQTIGTDVATTLYNEFRDNIQGLKGEADFKARVMPILRDKGWLKNLDDEALGSRVDLIFDTNLRTSRSIGKWNRIQANRALLPYLQFRTVGDERVRGEHRVLDRILLPVDHWFWDRHFPALWFGCRCVVSQLSRSQAARLGGVTDEATALAASEACGPTWQNAGMISAQLPRINTEAANDRAMPGAPVIDPRAGQMLGQAAWRVAFGIAAEIITERLIKALLEK